MFLKLLGVWGNFSLPTPWLWAWVITLLTNTINKTTPAELTIYFGHFLLSLHQQLTISEKR